MGTYCDEYAGEIQSLVSKLKGVPVEIHGQNSKIIKYYRIWSGNSDWLDYYVRYTNGQKEKARMLTPNLARHICRTWANNYANEDLTITIPNEKPNEVLQDILMENGFKGKFGNFVESFMGIGIGAIVVNVSAFELVDDGTNKRIVIKDGAKTKISFVGGRRVVPITVDDGEVTEVAFIKYKTNGATLIIHWLDQDGNYNVTEIVGTGDKGQIQWDELNQKTLHTYQKTPLFTIWKPNLTDEDDVDLAIGTSVFDKAMDSFQQVDLAYTSLWKELKLGQKTKFISTDIDVINENGERVAPFDEGDESVIHVPAGVDGKALMNEFNGELRVQSLVEDLNTHMNIAAMLCGLGQTQFEFGGAGGRPIQTATGVIAKQTELYRNVIKQENFAENTLKKLVKAIAFVNDTWTNNDKIGDLSMKDIQIMFDDNLVEDTSTKKQQDLNEVNSGVMSIAEYRSYWYDEDYESSLKYLQENGMLINKYLPALQSNAITPEMFVNYCFGAQYAKKQELINYIEEKQKSGLSDFNFELEGV